ncbi:MAG: GerMN domain-containing protein [Candidatus Peribacteraceae bacterium]|jgi:hypothetical protein
MVRITPLRITVLVLAVLAIGTIKLIWLYGGTVPQAGTPQTFEECAASGYPVMESYPRRCRFPDGTMVTEDIPGSSSLAAASSSSEDGVIRVYFGNSVRDPQVLDCGVTFAAERRIEGRSDAARAALEELLRGPTEAERAQGFFTSIPEGVTVRAFTLEDGVAKAEFDAALEQGVGGSCRVTAIRSQITNTLKQFSEVRDVVLSVDGRVEDILQP